MKNSLLFIASTMTLLSPLTYAGLCPKPWVCEPVAMEIPYTNVKLQYYGPLMPTLLPTVSMATETIRTGYLPHQGTFKGNILYFEGLGDSFVNHSPLFSKLSQAGYRVISFDYMGQGGSTGKMSRTRIDVIPQIGKTVWKKHAKDLNLFPKKTIMGWSTGGLAAYVAAIKNEVDQVVLLAPGISPNVNVGSGIFNWLPNEITMESLTTAAPYAASAYNPHIDPIKPNSPVKVPGFSVDLLSTAKAARKKDVPSSVKGLVLLSGEDDTYVDAEETRTVLKKHASHFQIHQYSGALHEIDNEIPEIQNKAINDILEFLKN